ncbi:ABC transporter ATP-binding protein [Micromonospora sp. NPDC051300]|uniref:ABC transporter ATP-binding protein n=1 Tax=Micromonospora sp. NPDC051300 TaxID=3364286 RepID=UPI0037977066
MSELRLTNLVKSFDGRRAVDDVSVVVPDSELLVLLGSSGCGKTTTLRMICGLETPDSGSISLGGRDITALPPQSRNLGMVFQDYGLYPAMDVRGNIAYGLQARNLNRAEIDRRVDDAAAQLGLTDKLQRGIGELSGGEQQRVALARALAKDADAFLFDEPLSNLDPKLRYQARRDIQAMHRAKGRPSVYITHDQNEAFALADRVAVMSAGRIHQVGPPSALLDEPADTFVARFIGEQPMNLLPVAIEENLGRPTPVVAGVGVELPGDLAVAASGRMSAILGVRTDAVRLGRRGDATATVTDVEPLVGETVVVLRLADGTPLRALVDDDVNPEVGESVSVRLDPAGLRLFDADSGLALA